MTNLIVALVAATNLCVFEPMTNAACEPDWGTACATNTGSTLPVSIETDGGLLEIERDAETVEVVTNVVKWDNSTPAAADIYSWGWSTNVVLLESTDASYWTWPQQGTPATERTEETIVTEIRRLRVTWGGDGFTLERKRELSRNLKRWVKKVTESWEVTR